MSPEARAEALGVLLGRLSRHGAVRAAGAILGAVLAALVVLRVSR